MVGSAGAVEMFWKGVCVISHQRICREVAKKPAQDDKSKTQNIVGRNYDLIWKVKITVDELATKDT